MLSALDIRDFAIIESLHLELHAGMTTLTGETGAGKSILLDALGLCLGDRADSASVRHGAKRAEVSAHFDISALPEVLAWLTQQQLDAESDCILRRVITAEGRSRGYINGQAAPLNLLKTLGEQLIDIHGQHEHQSLMRREAQLALLDTSLEQPQLAAELKTRYHHWQGLAEQWQQAQENSQQRLDRLELLSFQVEELERAELSAQTIADDGQEQQRLAHAETLIRGGQRSLELLSDYEQGNAHEFISQALNELRELCAHDNALETTVQTLDEALISLDEAVNDLRRHIDQIEIDPARLAWLDERLELYSRLARKHQCAVEQLPQRYQELADELATMQHGDADLEQLKAQVEQAEQDYLELAQQLREQRQHSAQRLSQRVSEAMQDLSMQGGRFHIVLKPRNTPNAQGLDDVEFQVSANPGQPLKPLSKVASGGELARISLAITVITAQNLAVPSLIFDEVDSGIGGSVAEIVGQTLHAIGEHAQVLCVTHLPQVAAQGDHQLRVSKSSDGEQTQTQIEELDAKQRIEEIARMLGGVTITQQTRAHAKEMLSASRRAR